MSREQFKLWCVSSLAVGLLVAADLGAGQVQVAYSNLPLSFEANQGQTDGQVKFLSRGPGYSLFLTATEAVLALHRAPESGVGQELPYDRHAPLLRAPGPNRPPAVLRMKLVGANPAPAVAGLEPLPGKSNYFLGNDPAQWRTNVPHYAKVEYREIYPGVNLLYYGRQHQLEYDLVVAPGADPAVIQLSFEGARKLRLDEQGDVVLETRGGEIRQHRPLVYQEMDGAKQAISGRYVLQGKRRVGFEVAAYDCSKPLVIDPVLVYFTYLGGKSNDFGAGIAVDASGNAYVTGSTLSTNFPLPPPPFVPFQAVNKGNYDAFVAKLTANGLLVYSTYLGDTGADFGQSIAVDSLGNAYVTGGTNSGNFPTAGPLQGFNGGGDAFVTKLNAAGNALVYSTFLGGTGLDVGLGIAVEGTHAYVTGRTESGDFPKPPPPFVPIQAMNAGGSDAFVAKLTAAGNDLVYSTYLGGEAFDQGNALSEPSPVTGHTAAGDERQGGGRGADSSG